MTRRAPAARSGLFARLIADRRGVSAVEFALLAPFMILIYFGLTEFGQPKAGETLVAMDVDGAKARDKSGAVDDGGKSASTAKSGKEGK